MTSKLLLLLGENTKKILMALTFFDIDIWGTRKANIAPIPTTEWIDPIKKNKHCKYGIQCNGSTSITIDMGQGNIVKINFG